jgi:hypothetical protein
MALVQIRIRCEKKFRDCKSNCYGCPEGKVVEVKALSGLKNSDDKQDRADKCPNCLKPITKWQEIQWVRGHRVHKSCVAQNSNSVS